jgi:hypothetical protein
MPPAGPTFLRDCWRSFIARSYFATTARLILQRKSHFREEKIIFRRARHRQQQQQTRMELLGFSLARRANCQLFFSLVGLSRCRRL